MATHSRANPKPNEFLAALPQDDRERLAAHLEPVELPLGKALYEPAASRSWVYFPAGSIISLLYTTQDGDASEIAIVGNEGFAGVSQLMAGGPSRTLAVVQSAGAAYRMKGDVMLREFQTSGAVQQWMLRYMQTLFNQVAQTAVCNCHHTVEQRLCRWLLMSMDRLPSNKLIMTQEMIAGMLGVRREGVTGAAGKLKRAGAIRYSRGRIEVLDRPRLEAMSCECYEAVRCEFARLLPWCV